MASLCYLFKKMNFWVDKFINVVDEILELEIGLRSQTTTMSSSRKVPLKVENDLFQEAKVEEDEMKAQKMLPTKQAQTKLKEIDSAFDKIM